MPVSLKNKIINSAYIIKPTSKQIMFKKYGAKSSQPFVRLFIYDLRVYDDLTMNHK